MDDEKPDIDGNTDVNPHAYNRALYKMLREFLDQNDAERWNPKTYGIGVEEEGS